MIAAEDRRGSTRAAGIVGMAILSSRILGLIREMVFAGSFRRGQKSRCVPNGVSVAEFVARLVCRRRAIDSVHHDVFEENRDRWR